MAETIYKNLEKSCKSIQAWRLNLRIQNLLLLISTEPQKSNLDGKANTLQTSYNCTKDSLTILCELI